MNIEEIKSKYEDYKVVENLVKYFKVVKKWKNKNIKTRANYVELCGINSDTDNMEASIRLHSYYILQDREQPNMPSCDEKVSLLDNINYRINFYRHFVKAIDKNFDSIMVTTLESMKKELEEYKREISKEIEVLKDINTDI